MVPAELLNLMHIFTVMHTAMLACAMVHMLFFVGDAKLAHPWRNPIAKNDEFGIKPQPLHVLETLEVSV